MMLEGIQNPVVRIENLGGHLRAFFIIPGEMQAKDADNSFVALLFDEFS
jgi:hypothetical protein